MGARNIAVVADYSDGDSYGGIRPAAAGDDVINGLVCEPEYQFTEGRIYSSVDGSHIQQGFYEPNDDVVHADWTATLDPVGSTVSKSGGVITLSVPAGQQSEWWAGTRNAARLEMVVPSFRRYEFWSGVQYPDMEDSGLLIGVNLERADEWVNFQRTKDGGNQNLWGTRGPNQVPYSGGGAGATVGWLKVVFDNDYFFYLWSNNALNDEPGDGDWNWGGNGYDLSWAWRPYKLRLMIAALSFATFPGATAQFTRPRWRAI